VVGEVDFWTQGEGAHRGLRVCAAGNCLHHDGTGEVAEDTGELETETGDNDSVSALGRGYFQLRQKRLQRLLEWACEGDLCP
jgi:hypothetical protein